jgi:hypothetical protein
MPISWWILILEADTAAGERYPAKTGDGTGTDEIKSGKFPRYYFIPELTARRQAKKIDHHQCNKLLTKKSAYVKRVFLYSPVAQSVEQVAVNHLVRGSSPRWGAIKNMADISMISAIYVFVTLWHRLLSRNPLQLQHVAS